MTQLQHRSSDSEVLTNRRAAVQVPQVVQFISQFDQFGLAAAMRRVFHLQALPLLLGQTLVIRHLLNDTSHGRSELRLELRRSGVCVLHRVMKESSLREGDSTHTLSNTRDSVLDRNLPITTYLQNLDVCDASFVAEDSCDSFKSADTEP